MLWGRDKCLRYILNLSLNTTIVRTHSESCYSKMDNGMEKSTRMKHRLVDPAFSSSSRTELLNIVSHGVSISLSHASARRLRAHIRRMSSREERHREWVSNASYWGTFKRFGRIPSEYKVQDFYI